MTERIAIKTDRVEDWKKGKLGPAVKNLTPRPIDNGLKSSWAHRDQDGQLPDILSNPAEATCRLQALAMYFFSERHSRARRNRVLGVSLRRDAVREDLVIEDSNQHPIPAYCTTHRSLALADEDVCTKVAERILAERAFDDWEYTRDEMAELLEYLLENGHVDPDLVNDARSLLLQWTS